MEAFLIKVGKIQSLPKDKRKWGKQLSYWKSQYSLYKSGYRGIELHDTTLNILGGV